MLCALYCVRNRYTNIMEGDSIREMFETCKHVTLFNGVRLGEMDLNCFATAFDLNDLPDSTGDLRRIRDQYHATNRPL